MTLFYSLSRLAQAAIGSWCSSAEFKAKVALDAIKGNKTINELASHARGVNHKQVARLMQQMGLETIYARPKTSVPADNVRCYPYLLDGLTIDAPNQV